MSTETAPIEERPCAVADEASAPFFAGLQERRLMIQRCEECGACQIGEYHCNVCHSARLQWTQAGGHATLYSFVIMHMAYHPGFAARLPYNAAVVELAEGPRFYSSVVDCRNEDLVVGMPLIADFEERGTAVMPVFRCDASALVRSGIDQGSV
ncbi:MAG: OB-fold domain-containing protein [Burkholderiaceae bacterium]|nr:OB-fold domain-containing protein [Burkholderiaceae bacterium]